MARFINFLLIACFKSFSFPNNIMFYQSYICTCTHSQARTQPNLHILTQTPVDGRDFSLSEVKLKNSVRPAIRSTELFSWDRVRLSHLCINLCFYPLTKAVVKYADDSKCSLRERRWVFCERYGLICIKACHIPEVDTMSSTIPGMMCVLWIYASVQKKKESYCVLGKFCNQFAVLSQPLASTINCLDHHSSFFPPP